MIERENWRKKERNLLIVSWVILILFLLPPFILGENSHIRVHDNLDSNITWYKVLHNSGELFGAINANVPQIIHGLPRNAFGTEFSLLQWLYQVFPSMTAYAISQAIVRVFAFLGMYLLLKRHFVKNPNAYIVRVLGALVFALTPFWPSGMLSTLGQPLALWAFLTIRERKGTWKEWLTLTLLPFYASFVLGFFFFLAAMGILWLRDLIVRKKWQLPFLISIAYMTALFLAIEYRLVYSLVFPEAPTSRDDFVLSHNNVWETILLIGKNYTIGHTHVMTVHEFIILPFSFVVLFVALFSKQKSLTKKYYLSLFILNIVLSVWYACWFYQGWTPIKEKIGLLNTFNFARFHFLRPLVIYMMFAVGAYFVWNKGKRWRYVVVFCLVAQLIILCICNPEIYYKNSPSYKQFYAEKQFKEIQDYIGKPQSSYEVVSIGIHPSIAQYNGFYTLDTYNNYYPLSYKRQFRKIIAKELDKSAVLKQYFDQWGGRCYIFVAELGKKYDYKKTSKKHIHHLDLNTKVLKQMGGQYVFSAVPIDNAEQDGLHFLKEFQSKESAWNIYLYQVK